MKLEQVFYGRGETGYAILSSSMPSCGLTDLVQDICGSVGTPGVERSEDDKPFLVQKTVGDTVVMACGRTGLPDSMGRRTLLFHVLCAPRSDMQRMGLSALELYHRRMFAAECPKGRIAALEIPDSPCKNPGGLHRLRLPAVVKCRRAESLDVLELLGDKIVTCNWASFSWRPLDEFDFYGLEFSHGLGSVPVTYNVYDSHGAVLRAGAEAPQETKEDVVIEKPRQRGRFPWDGVVVGATCFAVGFICGAKFTPTPHDVAASRPPTVQKLPVFDERHRIVDFEQEIGRKILPRDRQSAFVESLRAYVRFVNENFVSKNKEDSNE